MNTIGLRPPRPNADDARRALRKVDSWLSPHHPVSPSSSQPSAASLDLHVATPPMIPWMRPRLAREVNRRSVARTLRREGERLGIHRPVLVVTVPNGIDARAVLAERTLVYYCVDDFTNWPGIDGVAADQLENELLAHADVVIATSENLAKTRTRAGLRTHVLPHGVDLTHLSKASDPETPMLDGVRRGRPVLGYLGLIDARTDYELLAGIARARRDWDIVLVGPIDQVPSGLRAEANIRAIPGVPYARVPEALASFDVAILPYARNALTDSINPLKLREYLASGRPVVSTGLPEVARFVPHVRIANNVVEFVRESAAALDGPRDQRDSRRALLASESWEARAARFLELCGIEPPAASVGEEQLARSEVVG